MCVQVVSMIQLMLPRGAESVLALHDTSHISVFSRSSFFLFLYTTNLSDQLLASLKLTFPEIGPLFSCSAQTTAPACPFSSIL